MYYDVAKINKRVHIIDGRTKIIYTPPDFIRDKMTNREKLKTLAEKFNQIGGRDIDAIIEFEASFYDRQ